MQTSLGASTAEAPQQEAQAKLSNLKNVRILLEEARLHARETGDAEGELVQARIGTTLREVNRRILELNAR